MGRRCIQHLQPGCHAQRPSVCADDLHSLIDDECRRFALILSTQPPSYDGHKPRRDNHSVLSSVLSISATSSRNDRAHTCVRPGLFRWANAWTHRARRLVCGHAYTCGDQAAPRIAHPLEKPAVVLVPEKRRLCASGQRLRGGVLMSCISCSDLMSVPEDLREVLETCLLKTHPQTTWLYIYQRCPICSMASVPSSPCTVALCSNTNHTNAPPTPAQTADPRGQTGTAVQLREHPYEHRRNVQKHNLT